MSQSNILPMPRREPLLVEQDLTQAFEQLLSAVARYAEHSVNQIREAKQIALQEIGPGQSLWDLKQAATYLGMTKRWLDEQTRGKGTVPFVMLGGRKKFRKASLDAWLEDRETKGMKVSL